MKHLYLTLFILLFAWAHGNAQCTGAQVTIHIVPDQYYYETSWQLFDDQTQALIDSGSYYDDTVCVGANQCVRFTIYDSYGDGMCCAFGNGSYSVKLNGSLVAVGGSFGASESTVFNCPQGYNCSNPLNAVVDTMVAPGPETWYVFVPDSTGSYSISTCNLGNACDTKLYIYDHCTGIVPTEDNQGTTFYSDDFCANNQAQINGAFLAGYTYYIRVGDYLNACAGLPLTWLIEYNGPIAGCTDSASCNYNPLATISDGSCVYPPSLLCPSPDLVVDEVDLINSMYRDDLTVNPNDCYISEGCLSGYGTRQLIRFSTHIKNIGELDYFIGAPDTVGNQFIYDACHQHWHYAGYAEYLLLNTAHQQVLSGFKNGFCVLDLECSGGGNGKYSCGNMGITAGCGDIYDSGLDCQWIDVTDVDTGNYTLVVRVNWDHSPDKLGRLERSYDNNWGQACFNLHYDNFGDKAFTILPLCNAYVDCAGDTFGNAVTDCKGVCNGTTVNGDLNIDYAADSLDFNLYLEKLKDETLPYTYCDDLNGDSTMTVTDAARLNGCLLFNRGVHHHQGNFQNTHKHCEFPENIVNPYDSIEFSLAGINTQQKYVDLKVLSPTCYLLGYEFKMHGLVADTIINLATGNYKPDVRISPAGHVVGIAADENVLLRQQVPLTFLRIYYTALTDTLVCIQELIDVINANYEQVHGRLKNNCLTVPATAVGIPEVPLTPGDVKVIPNPNNGQFDIYLAEGTLNGADIIITNAIGQTVYSSKAETTSNSVKITLNDHEKGIYLLQLNIKGQVLVKKLVITTQ